MGLWPETIISIVFVYTDSVASAVAIAASAVKYTAKLEKDRARLLLSCASVVPLSSGNCLQAQLTLSIPSCSCASSRVDLLH